MISLWKYLLLGDTEKILFEHDLSGSMKDDDMRFVIVREAIEKLFSVINEPRNYTCFRVILLASSGHFAGFVFDGNTVVTQKTFNRYVVRAKAGKKQSSKDVGGKIAHSAGASIRRHNELALNKANKDAKRKARAKELKRLRKASEKKAKEAAPCSHQGSHWISSRATGAFVLVIGSLMVVAFGQMVKGRNHNERRILRRR